MVVYSSKHQRACSANKRRLILFNVMNFVLGIIIQTVSLYWPSFPLFTLVWLFIRKCMLNKIIAWMLVLTREPVDYIQYETVFFSNTKIDLSLKREKQIINTAYSRKIQETNRSGNDYIYGINNNKNTHMYIYMRHNKHGLFLIRWTLHFLLRAFAVSKNKYQIRSHNWTSLLNMRLQFVRKHW